MYSPTEIETQYYAYNTLGEYDQLGRQNARQIASTWTGHNYDGINRRTVSDLYFSNGGGNLNTALGYNPASQIVSEARNNSSYVWSGGVNVARNYTVNGLNQYLSAGPASFGYDLARAQRLP